MALLAGVKRKQRIGLDPNNSNWAKDTSAVGQSMMKKMGWKEGTGLGANEDGRVIPVKAVMKCNTAGLGCSPQQADAWIAHGEEFDQILASLNASTDNGCDSASGRSSSKEEMEGQRRFYGRFSRGGVKKKRTAEDLNCIFGRRTTSAGNESKEETKSEDSSDGAEDKSETKDVDKSLGVETITSTYSVQEYFAQKLKKLNQKKENAAGDLKPLEVEDCNKSDDEKPSTGTEVLDFNSYVTSTFSVRDYLSHKMRMKKEKLNTTGNCEGDNLASIERANVGEARLMGYPEEEAETDIKIKKKKKKKRKAEDVNDMENDLPADENNCTEEKVEKKKKKKKIKDADICDDEASVKEDTSTRKGKKRKASDVENCEEDSPREEKSQKKKRKKKKAEGDVKEPVDNMDALCTEENTKMKKKKKKKRMNEDMS